jgi:predicted  nucleic acid-binding Zn-ribbon protein
LDGLENGMHLTDKLRKVFEVEKQLRGLKARLHEAERSLAKYEKDLTGIQTDKSKLEADLKQLTAQAANFEGETKRIDARMAVLKEQMDNAKTNKEYKAFLTELNTFKADRDRNEQSALEIMTKADDLKKQITSLDGKKGEREQLKTVAANDRTARHNEIADRLSELTAQRDTLVKDLPPEALRDLQRLLETRGEDAMGIVEVVDVKRGEFHCSVCMMSLPIDKALGLVKGDRITKCTSCQCILYLDEAGALSLNPNARAQAKEDAKIRSLSTGPKPKGSKKPKAEPAPATPEA